MLLESTDGGEPFWKLVDLSQPYITDLPRLLLEMNRGLRTVYPWPVKSSRNQFAHFKQLVLLGMGFVPHPTTPSYGSDALTQGQEVG